MLLPNFLIVGAQKCGTTSLHDILSAHPEVLMSNIKETNFFIDEKKYLKGKDFYSQYFKNQKNAPIAIGESSPGYICYPGVAEKIKNDLGSIKIVIIIRDPIKRAFSQYWDNRRSLSEYLTEDEIVDKYLEENYSPGRMGYFSRGVYINYISNYVGLFGESRIHIMLLEDLISNPLFELRRLYSFLDVDPYKGLQELPVASNEARIWDNPIYEFFFNNPNYIKFLPKRGRSILFFGKTHKFKYELPNKKILSVLKDFYNPFNRKLELLLGRKFEDWI